MIAWHKREHVVGALAALSQPARWVPSLFLVMLCLSSVRASGQG